MNDEDMPTTKIDNSGNLIIFSGTEGGLDYVMFSMTEGYAIGLKPILGIGHHEVDFLYRIRAIPYQSPKEDGTVTAAFGVTADSIAAAFSGFSFDKKSDKRCSLVCQGQHTKDLGAGEIKKLIGWFNQSQVVNEIMVTLAQRLGIDKWDNGEEISEWIKATYITTLENVAKNMGTPMTDEATGPASVTNIADAGVSEQDVDAEAAALKDEMANSAMAPGGIEIPAEGEAPEGSETTTGESSAIDPATDEGYTLDDGTKPETETKE